MHLSRKHIYSMFYFSIQWVGEWRTAWTDSLRIVNEVHRFIKKKDPTQMKA